MKTKEKVLEKLDKELLSGKRIKGKLIDPVERAIDLTIKECDRGYEDNTI